MGRKIKRNMILVIVLILSAGCCVQSATWAYAKEEVQAEAPQGEAEEDQGGTDGEEEKPLPPIVLYELQCPKPNGKNGYFVTKPNVSLTHVSERGVTKYAFTDGKEKVLEGELKEKDSGVVFAQEQFSEGSNRLSVWMEEEGVKVPDSEWSQEFFVDTAAPELSLSAPRGLDTWYQKEVCLSVNGSDGEAGSQVERISCYAGNRLLGVSDKVHAGFYIRTPSAGGKGCAVRILITDKAGNTKEVEQQLYIDCNPPEISIGGVENYMITSSPVEVAYGIKEDNVLSETKVYTEWTDVEGKKTPVSEGGWEEEQNSRTMHQQLKEDGIYEMSLSASDRAGYEQSKRVKIIIDKKNPVISYVDKLQDSYVKEFQWNYASQEIIKDFTSFTYEIRLDEKLYPMGRNITKEGRHTLKVAARDSAGNEARAQADFVVDHTSPEIIFAGIEAGECYEEEKEFQIKTKYPEDKILSVRINGEEQKLGKSQSEQGVHLQECQDYQVAVMARDRAGNERTRKIYFEIAPKETVLEKIWKPMRQGLGMEPKEAVKETKEKGDKPLLPWLLIAGTVLAIGGGLSYGVWKYFAAKRP